MRFQHAAGRVSSLSFKHYYRVLKIKSPNHVIHGHLVRQCYAVLAIILTKGACLLAHLIV